MLTGLDQAIAILLSPEGMLIWIIGGTVGGICALVPGISGTQAMAVLLPFTFVMSQAEAMLFLAAIMASAGFSGSITSILLNVPGDPTNAATTLDGYPLARQGKAGYAIAASATASALGALVGLVVLAASIPILRELVLSFGPPELFAFAIAGVALIGAATGGSQVKGLIAGAVGMMFAAIGYNNVTGEVRFTGGLLDLWDGIPLIAAVVGLFSIPELYSLLRTNQSVSRTGTVVKGGVSAGVKAVLKRPGLVARSSLLGTGIGMVPGVGGAIASWIAYFAAKRTSRSPETFGKGNIEGVIAPDATLNAKEGGAMMPTLALGLPGDLSTAILLSAFLLHGVTPGQRMFTDHMDLVWLMILCMVVVNLLSSVIGLITANQMVKLTLVPARVLVPIMLVLVLLGSYVERQAFSSIIIAVGFGVLGIVMTRLGYPRAPLLVGFMLFPIAEDNFHISRRISWGSYDFLLRPITLGILIVVIAAMTLPYIWRRWVRRRVRSREDPMSDLAFGGGQGTPVQDLAAAGVLVLGSIAAIVVSSQYHDDTQFFPLIVLVAMIGLAMWLAVSAVLTLRRERRSVAVRELALVGARATVAVGRPGAADTEPDALADVQPDIRSDAEPDPEAPETAADGSSMLGTMGWIMALPVLFWLLGAVVGIFVYTLVFMLGYRASRLRLGRVSFSVAMALATAAIAYFGFQDLLAVQLPAGVLVPIAP